MTNTCVDERRTSLPVLDTPPTVGRSTSTSTTSPSITLLSSLMRTPIALRNACVRASVFPISMLKISLAPIAANGVSSPNAFAMPCAARGRVRAAGGESGDGRASGRGLRARGGRRAMAIAVLPVPG